MNSKQDSLLKGILHGVIAVVVLAAVAWIYFYPADVQGDRLQQHDILQGIANSQQSIDFQNKSGEITRWTDALFGGMPTFQIRPTYSTSPWLTWVQKVFSLGMPEPVSWIFMMMLGFFVLMLAFKVRWYLAVLGAIGYGFSSYFFILIGAGHIWKLLTLVYVAPTLAGIVWAYRGKILGGTALATLAGAMQLLSNHVQMSYYFAFLIVGLVIGFLIEAIRGHKVGQWAMATCALVVGALLAVAANAPNLYMSYKYSQQTIRGGHSELATETSSNGGLDKEYITQWSYGQGETFTLMIPNVKGGATVRPEHGQMKMLTLSDTKQAERAGEQGKIDPQSMQVLGQFPQYFGDQPMTNGPVYVGVLIFALALLGVAVVRGPVKWSIVVVTVLTIFLSWGHNMMWLTDLFIDYFPMYNKFRTPASFLVVAELTLPLLAVLAVREMIEREDFFKRNRWAIAGAFGFTALVCVLTWLVPSIFGAYSAQEHEQLIATGQLRQYPAVDAAVRLVRGAMVSDDALRSLIVLLLGCGVIAGLWKRKLTPTVATLALAAIVLVDMYTVDKRYLNQDTFVPAEQVVETGFTARPADKQILADTTLHYRVMDIQNFSEAMPSYFHRTIGGYHAAKLTRYNDLIEHQIAKNNIQVLNMLNAKYFIINPTTVQQNPDALGNAWFVDTLVTVAGPQAEMSALDNLHPATTAVADAQFAKTLGKAQPRQAGDTIALTAYAPNQLTYRSHSANGGLAVFSEVYFPWGWQATIDNKPAEIGRVNYILRAMQVPAGDHTIVMRFDPPEVHQTETIATVAIAVIFALLLLSANFALLPYLRRNKKQD